MLQKILRVCLLQTAADADGDGIAVQFPQPHHRRLLSVVMQRMFEGFANSNVRNIFPCRITRSTILKSTVYPLSQTGR